MIVIGDVHGKFVEYEKLCRKFKDKSTVQLGDMGVGFGSAIVTFGTKDYFFRGNHDNPSVARRMPNHLGEGGMTRIGEEEFFYIPGAWSIDRSMRIEGITWWADEELSIPTLFDLTEAYTKAKPKIVISHDAPEYVAHTLLNRFKLSTDNPEPLFRTRTGQALQAMFELHQPELWVFGHYHVDWSRVINGTKFLCLNELSWTEI